MRGRTNISSGGGAVVNGDIQNYEVAPNNIIGAGDFVELEYKSNEDFTLFTSNTQKKGIKIANHKSMLIAYQQGDSNSAYSVGIFDYTDHKLKLNSNVLLLSTSFLSTYVFQLTDSIYCFSCAHSSGDPAIIVVKVWLTNGTWNIQQITQPHVTDFGNIQRSSIIACALNTDALEVALGYANYEYVSSSKTYNIRYIATVFTIVDNGNAAPTVSQKHTGDNLLYKGSYGRPDIYYSFFLNRAGNDANIAVYYTYKYSTSSPTYHMIKYASISSSYSYIYSHDLVTLGTSNYSSYNFYPARIGNDIWIATQNLYQHENLLKTLNDFSISTHDNIYSIKENVICNIRDSGNMQYQMNILEYIPETSSHIVSNSVEIENIDTSLIGGYMEIGENIYLMLIGKGFYCFYYNNGLLKKGYPGLSDMVKKYIGESAIKGVAKTGGASGETIQVYVPPNK